MEKTAHLLSKRRPIRPLFHADLATSTPDSHQIAKRIKLQYSYFEHYKGACDVEVDPGFPLCSRDYRRSRELHLELPHTEKKSKYLQKFLQSLKNVQKLRIKVLVKEALGQQRRISNTDTVKRLLEALCRVHWLQRVHIDLPKESKNQVFSLGNKLRRLRSLSKLKDLAITIEGEEVYPFSVGLSKVGSSIQTPNPHESIMVIEETSQIAKLMKRTPKFEQLDTIRGNVKWYAPEKLFDGFAFVISRLGNLRELGFNSAACNDIPINRIRKILGALVDLQKLEILRMGLQIKNISQLDLLKDPVFSKSSLRITHLSLFLFNQIMLKIEDFQKMFDLLQEIPSLEGLYLDLFAYVRIENDALEDYTKRVCSLVKIRKLKIVFNYNESKFGAKQAGNIIRRIFNTMHFLEELDLQFPKNCIDFNRDDDDDIQGLKNLKKARIQLKECDEKNEKAIWGIMELFGKCQKLRELELDFTNSLHNARETTGRLCESLAKLKELQVFRLFTNELLVSDGEESSMGLVEDMVKVFDKLRNLQDFHLDIKLAPHRAGGMENFLKLIRKVKNSSKYRFIYLGYFDYNF